MEMGFAPAKDSCRGRPSMVLVVVAAPAMRAEALESRSLKFGC